MDLTYNISIILLALVGGVSSLILTRLFGIFFGRRGLVGIDIFKSDRPEVPLLGGLSIPVTLVVFIFIGYFLGLLSPEYFLGLSLLLILILGMGLVDDFLSVSGLYKPLVCLLGGLPIIFFHLYNPHLSFPLGVGFRISIIYMLMIPFGISIAANTVNMLDVINGIAATGAIIVMIVILASTLILGRSVNTYPIILGITVLLGFLFYNRYPSKVFLGNAPALVVGAYIGALAIIYNVEFPTVVAMFPFIHNSFFFLNKIRRFVEHKQLNVRVTDLDDEEHICDARDDRAPITLLRFIVSKEPLREYEAYLNISLLFLFSAFLALASAFLMW